MEPRSFIFADEAGDFVFKRGENKSFYFILCTLRFHSCDLGGALLNLRRRLIYQGTRLQDKFHATTDSKKVRTEVFDTIKDYDFRIDATILEKPKALPKIRRKEDIFYKYAWYYHAKFLAPQLFRYRRNILITAAALETKRGKAAFKSAFNDAVQQTIPHKDYAIDFPPSASDPCLQAADYCAWAIQRKWERGDTNSYDLIKDKIKSEFDLWERGDTHYY